MIFSWEARNLAGQNIPQETLRYYSSGIPHGEHNQLLNTYNVAGFLQWNTDRDSMLKINSGLSEKLTAFIQSGEVVIVEQNFMKKRGMKAGLKGASSKRKRSFNSPLKRSFHGSAMRQNVMKRKFNMESLYSKMLCIFEFFVHYFAFKYFVFIFRAAF